MWNKHKRKIFILAAIALPLTLLYYTVRVPIALAVVERLMVNRMEAAPFYDHLPDGLHLALCGAGSPLPDTKRSGPCIAVVAGKQFFVFDAGTNGARNLGRMGWGVGLVQAVFLTHFHSDHIDGLGELSTLRWVNADHEAPLPVYGPAGVKEVVAGFNRAYRLDSTYRTAHHGEAIAPTKAAGMVANTFAIKKGEKVVVWDKEGVQIYAFRVEHDPIDPAVGYRIEYKGRVITISGDTKASQAVEKFAAGSDLLAHEALSPKLVGLITSAAEQAGNKRLVKITNDILNYHTTPVEAGRIATNAKVRHLLLYHIVPPLPLSALEEVFLEGVDEVWDGGLTLGKDGVMFSLPAVEEKSEDDDDDEEEEAPEIIIDELL